MKRETKDSIKTVFVVIAIVFAIVAYLRTNEYGTLLVQRGLHQDIEVLNTTISGLYGEIPKSLRDILNN